MRITCKYCGTSFNENEYLRCPTCDAPFGNDIEHTKEIRDKIEQDTEEMNTVKCM